MNIVIFYLLINKLNKEDLSLMHFCAFRCEFIDLVSLRSKRFESSYSAKVHSFFFAFVPIFLTNSRGNACYAGYDLVDFLALLLYPFSNSSRITYNSLGIITNASTVIGGEATECTEL